MLLWLGCCVMVPGQQVLLVLQMLPVLRVLPDPAPVLLLCCCVPAAVACCRMLLCCWQGTQAVLQALLSPDRALLLVRQQ